MLVDTTKPLFAANPALKAKILRENADKLDPFIARASKELVEDTPQKKRDGNCRRRDKRVLTAMQMLMRAMATMHDTETIPPVIKDLKFPPDIRPMVERIISAIDRRRDGAESAPMGAAHLAVQDILLNLRGAL